MIKKITLVILLLIFCDTLSLLAQKEAWNWCYGDSIGITFAPNGTNPRLLNNIKRHSYWATGSISDKYGNLLFYTNGINVWNSNNEIMTGSSNISGKISDVNNVFILPAPGDSNLYYIFTSFLDTLTKNVKFGYLMIDMRLNNGYGDISNSYIVLLSNKSLYNFTAANHSNNFYYWLVCPISLDSFKSTDFVTFLLTEKGIVKYNNNHFSTLGIDYTFRVSPDNKKIAFSRYNLKRGQTDYIDTLCLFDFDNSSGILSNLRNLNLHSDSEPPFNNQGVGRLEFSPNSSFIYWIRCFHGLTPNNIYQFDITKGSEDEIYQSKTIIAYDTLKSFDLLLGPDNKIYSTMSNVINYPDKKGIACSYQNKPIIQYWGHFLSSGSRLPKFLRSYNNFQFSLRLPQDTILCKGSDLTITPIVKSEKTITKYHWDGPNFSSDSKTLSLFNLDSSKAGTYLLTTSIGEINIYDTLFVRVKYPPKIKIFPSDTVVLCNGASVKLTGNIDSSTIFYWSTGDSTKEITVSKPGKYTLFAENEMGCRDSSSVIVKYDNKFKVKIIGQNEFCEGDTILLTAVPTGVSYKYLWSTGETTSSIKVTNQGYYWVKVFLNSACQDSTGISITALDKPTVSISALGSTKFCEGDSVSLVANASSAAEYQWSDYYSENFDKRKSYPEWSTHVSDPEWQNPIKPDSNDFPSIRYLGVFGNQRIKLSLKNLPQHDSVSADFDLYVIGTWDGNIQSENGPDLFRVEDLDCNTSSVRTTSFCRMTGSVQSYPEDYPLGNYPKDAGALEKLQMTNEQITISASRYRLHYTFPHNCSDLSLELSAILKDISSNFQNESWAIDNFSVRLNTVKSDPMIRYEWSTGDTSKSITVGKSGNYTVTATNQAGCSDSSSIYIKVNPNPVVTISGNNKICRGEKATLTVDGFYKDYSWSNGENTQSITVEAPIPYKVIVTDTNGCTGSAEVTVSLFEKPKVRIIGDTAFCTGKFASLSSDSDFVRYLWSTGDTTKQIAVDKPGVYKLDVTDINGCKNSASISVIENNIKLMGMTDLMYSSSSVHSQNRQTITLTNQSKIDISIKSVRSKNSNSIFTIDLVDPLPLNLTSMKSLTIGVTFKPDDFVDYSDSLIVEIDQPCSIVSSSYLSGKNSASSFVWLPDTTASIKDEYFCIPLRVRVDSTVLSANSLNYSAEIRFDATAMDIKNIPASIIAGERVITVNSGNIILDSQYKSIFDICGKIYLPDVDNVPLKIIKFEWLNRNISVLTDDGSLKVTGICKPGISRVEMIKNSEFILEKNVVSDRLSITTKNTTKDDILTIYSIIGIEVGSYNCTEQLDLDISDLSTGLYFVRLGHLTKKFVKL